MDREGIVAKRGAEPYRRGIFFAGVSIAAGTFLVLHVSMPEGLRYAQTMAFTTLVFFSLFQIFNARSDARSAFVGMFANKWLARNPVVAAPQGRSRLHTVSPSGVLYDDVSFDGWLLCAAVASSVLWLRELTKAKVLGRIRKSRRCDERWR